MIFAREPFAVRAFATYPEITTQPVSANIDALLVFSYSATTDLDSVLAALRSNTTSLDALIGNLLPAQVSDERIVIVSGLERVVNVSAEERIVTISG